VCEVSARVSKCSYHIWVYTWLANAAAVVANTFERWTYTLDIPPREDVCNPDKEMLLM